jgi:ribosomal protein S18 acetylase RimI-like enzyme
MNLPDQRPISYFKRYRMELELWAGAAGAAELPPGYFWVPWQEGLLEHHAEVLYQAFFGTIDAVVFSCFSDRQGCSRLMSEIRYKRGFLPECTWLIGSPDGYCGTVQGRRERGGLGAIQNVGVTAAHGGRGLGSALVAQALTGFRRAGLGKAYLEVTASNERAVRLYRRLGFLRRKTLYKAVQTETTCA